MNGEYGGDKGLKVDRLKRSLWLALFVGAVLTVSALYAMMTGGVRVIEVKATCTETENFSVKGAVEDIVALTNEVERSLAEGSVVIGGDLGDVVGLILDSEQETEEMWNLLHVVVDSYFDIRDTVYRLNQAWLEPEEFDSDWFEDPADAARYSELAQEMNATGFQVLDDGSVDIQLSPNLSLANVTYTVKWTTAKSEASVEVTHILVRDNAAWKYRYIDSEIWSWNSRE